MFGISLIELFLIFIISLLILSPKDWILLSRKAGVLVRKVKTFISSFSNIDEKEFIKDEIKKIKEELKKND